MKNHNVNKTLCLLLTLLSLVLMFSSCKETETPSKTYKETDLPTLAPAECETEIPVLLCPDIDELDLSEFSVLEKHEQQIDNEDGTKTAVSVTVYVNEENGMSVEITVDSSGNFTGGTIYYSDETGVTVATAHYSSPYKEISDVVFNRNFNERGSWSEEQYITAYFDEEICTHAVYTHIVNNVRKNVTTPAYYSVAVYTNDGKLISSYVSVTGESDFRYYNNRYEPVTQTIYSVLVASIQYADYLLDDEQIASYADKELAVELPEGLSDEFSKFVKTDDYVLTETKANIYGDDLKDDNGNPFSTTTEIYKNEKNGYTVEMTTVDESDYLFVANVRCEDPKFTVAYREDGVLDYYTDYQNTCQYACFYNNDFSISYYSMDYSVYCGTDKSATADIISEYSPENKLLRYSVVYSFGLTIYYNADGDMIEDDEFDLLNTAANYQ